MNLPQCVSFREYVPTIPPLFYLSTHLFKPTELNIFFLARIVSDELAPCGKPRQQAEQSLLAIHVWAVVVPEHLDTKSTSSAVVLYCTFVAAVSSSNVEGTPNVFRNSFVAPEIMGGFLTQIGGFRAFGQLELHQPSTCVVKHKASLIIS